MYILKDFLRSIFKNQRVREKSQKKQSFLLTNSIQDTFKKFLGLCDVTNFSGPPTHLSQNFRKSADPTHPLSRGHTFWTFPKGLS